MISRRDPDLAFIGGGQTPEAVTLSGISGPRGLGISPSMKLERPAVFDHLVALHDASGFLFRNRATRSPWNAKYPEATARSLSLSSAFNFARAKKGTAGNRWCAV